jgi:hypothetical protein
MLEVVHANEKENSMSELARRDLFKTTLAAPAIAAASAETADAEQERSPFLGNL